jgi:hypothetical protein
MQAVSAQTVEKGVWEELEPIADQTVIATGTMVAVALPVARKFGAGLINARTIQPLDEEMLARVRRVSKRGRGSWKKAWIASAFACSRAFSAARRRCACRTIPFRRRASTTSGNYAG